MNYIFKKNHLEVMNKMFEDEMTNLVIKIEERFNKTTKRVTSLAPGAYGRLMSIVTDVDFPEIFIGYFNSVSDRYSIKHWSKNAADQYVITVADKSIKIKVRGIVYRYNPLTKVLESIGGAHKITGIEAEQVKLACKYINLLSLEEPFNFSYKDFLIVVGEYIMNGKKAK